MSSEIDAEEERGSVQPAKPAKRRVVRLLLSLSAAAVLLTVVFWLADLEELWNRLSGADLTLLGFSLLVYVTTYVARARRFSVAGAKASTWTLFWVVTIQTALNRLMPLRTGELSYPVLVKRLGAAKMGEGLVQLLMLRILDLLTIVLLFLLALAASIVLGTSGLGEDSGALAVAAAVIALICLAVLWRLGAFLRLGLAMVRRILPLLGESLRARGGPLVD